jgi:hypothetical protein
MIMIDFLESNNENGVLYAPTQVGKTNKICKIIEKCILLKIPVILSTDNKKDQQEQFVYRIKTNIKKIILVNISDKKCESVISDCIKNNKHFVLCVLDNNYQAEKLIVLLTSVYTRYNEMNKIKKILMIHDEADMITKDKDTKNIVETQCESHKKWLELIDIFHSKKIDIELKRLFVTATPENCVLLYDIYSPYLIKLEIPKSYVGYNKLVFSNINKKESVLDMLQHEVERIKKNNTNEAILYCIDRKISDGQNTILESLSKSLKCILNTYNGNGIMTYMRTNKLSKSFERVLEDKKIKYVKEEKYYTIKNITIRCFYQILKSINENCVITIGKDLICRGISYVGEDEVNPITATTMFYKPGPQMHAVGICQTIGRITRNAMPNLIRKIYTSKDVYNTYIKYNINQEKYINETIDKKVLVNNPYKKCRKT